MDCPIMDDPTQEEPGEENNGASPVITDDPGDTADAALVPASMLQIKNISRPPSGADASLLKRSGFPFR